MVCTEQKDQASTADGVLWSRDRSSAGHSSGGTAAQKHPPPLVEPNCTQVTRTLAQMMR